MAMNVSGLIDVKSEFEPLVLTREVTAEALMEPVSSTAGTVTYVTSGSSSLAFGDQFCQIRAEGFESFVFLGLGEQLLSRMEQQESWSHAEGEEEEAAFVEAYARYADLLRTVLDWCSSSKPDFANYMSRIESLAEKYEAERVNISREKLEAVYDDAFLEAEKYQKDLL